MSLSARALWSMSTLAGLMSRCMMPLLCVKSSACSSCLLDGARALIVCGVLLWVGVSWGVG
jgi:hypothetical protein